MIGKAAERFDLPGLILSPSLRCLTTQALALPVTEILDPLGIFLNRIIETLFLTRESFLPTAVHPGFSGTISRVGQSNLRSESPIEMRDSTKLRTTPVEPCLCMSSAFPFPPILSKLVQLYFSSIFSFFLVHLQNVHKHTSLSVSFGSKPEQYKITLSVIIQ